MNLRLNVFSRHVSLKSKFVLCFKFHLKDHVNERTDLRIFGDNLNFTKCISLKEFKIAFPISSCLNEKHVNDCSLLSYD